MPRLLHIDSSADEQNSVSRAVTATFAGAWSARGEDFAVDRLDLHVTPPPHLPDAALHWAPRLRAPGTQVDTAAQQVQDAYIAQLLEADVLVVGVPMYNWSLPSTLKAWFDHIHVPGLTTPFDDPSAQPLKGRHAVIVVTSGAGYQPGSPNEGMDHTTPAAELLLGRALGMEVSVITVEFTLAERIPAMASLRELAAANLAAAHSRATELAEQL